ncbi:rfwd3 protein [Anaeramoeba ignava]|uniref:RING-type E3 ubiquitin transferase n=1 Tax=Anaeramoeba ignava TaxID=1746090 RepID=A0A9Q0RAG6_ANAIG|nr:rfwd3 protein [Anaeramoeba ignava]
MEIEKEIEKEKEKNLNEICSICFEEMTLSGKHTICSLPCGHLICKSCVENLVKDKRNNEGECPFCKLPFVLRKVRTLKQTQMFILDNTDLHSLEEELENLQKEIQKKKKEIQILESSEKLMKYTNQQIMKSIEEKEEKKEEITQKEKARKEMEENKTLPIFEFSQQPRTPLTLETAPILFSQSTLKINQSENINSKQIPNEKLENLQNSHFKDVNAIQLQGAYVHELNPVDNCLYSSCFFGSNYQICRIPLELDSEFEYYNLHKKLIRDIKCNQSPNQTSTSTLILSVSEDKTAQITDTRMNRQIMTFLLFESGYSCCFDKSNPFHFFCGSNSGNVLTFDYRNTTSILNSFKVHDRDFPVNSLSFAEISPQNNSFGNSVLNGLISCVGNSVFFLRQKPNSDLGFEKIVLDSSLGIPLHVGYSSNSQIFWSVFKSLSPNTQTSFQLFNLNYGSNFQINQSKIWEHTLDYQNENNIFPFQVFDCFGKSFCATLSENSSSISVFDIQSQSLFEQFNSSKSQVLNSIHQLEKNSFQQITDIKTISLPNKIILSYISNNTISIFKKGNF